MATPQAFRNYLNTLGQKLATGGATEHTHRSALEALIESLDNDLTAINEPRHIECGAPDLAVRRGEFRVGHIEAKDIGVSLDAAERSDQLKRYRQSLSNLILTDYLEFRWYVDGELRRTASLGRLDAYDSIQRIKGGVQTVNDLLGDFLAHRPEPIATPQALAERMARLTHLIREIIITAFEKEKASDLLVSWRKAFAEVLVEGLDEPENVGQFADMFAQTLAYGLFSARLLHDHGPFDRQQAQDLIPETNPFLKEFFYYITGPQLKNEPYAGLVEDLVQILDHADMEAILTDFGRRTRQDDPTVHFYETFLSVYDPDLRERRGVFYTPNPIVSFIVRSVDQLLKSKFGLIDGLADTTRLPDGTHKVLVLDPACGTATFLYHIIDLIRADFMAQNNAGMWSGYVHDHLLPRIFGFELLMAPYAVAHFKLALQLAGYDLPTPQQKQWTYDFASEERLQIYLTNALEIMSEESPRLFGPAEIIAEEAKAADEVKQEKPIMVIVGNPPYSVSSSNKGAFIEDLMDRYKEAVRDERNIQPLSDDYIKFIRFAHDRVERTGSGVVGMITNHSYLSGLIHRGMREEILKTFDEIYILNLHGNALIGETAPDGGMDKNVFDIRQGVSIVLMVKTGNIKTHATVYYTDLWGTRDEKYRVLNENDLARLDWEILNPVEPHYFFVPKDLELKEEYEEGWLVEDIYPVNSSGMNTLHDSLVISFDKDDLIGMLRDATDSSVSDDEFDSRYDVHDSRDWTLAECRKKAIKKGFKEYQDSVVKCMYRPFDYRWIVLHDDFVGYARWDTTHHFLPPSALGLVTGKQSRKTVSCLVSDLPLGQHKIVDPYHRSYVFPVYLYPGRNTGMLFDDTDVSLWSPDSVHGDRVPNLEPEFVASVERNLELTFEANKSNTIFGEKFGPRDILAYTYAILHSRIYRERYAEFLQYNFPRVHISSDPDLFWKLVALGNELVQLHLMEHSKLAHRITSYPVNGTNRVKRRGGFPTFIPKGESRTKTGEIADKNRVYINLEQYFDGVPKEVWEFEVGGYQVLYKWLKDRRGRVLNYDELNHYQRIVVALQETIRLMDEIDAVIPSWPII